MAVLPKDFYILVTCPEIVTISDNQCNDDYDNLPATFGVVEANATEDEKEKGRDVEPHRSAYSLTLRGKV